MQNEQDIEQIINREIELTRLFFSMIKDTKDELEEYFRLNNYTESEKQICLISFINRLKQSLNIEVKQ